MNSVFSLDNEAFASLVLYGTLALAKTAAMSWVTSYYRHKHNSVPSIEDAKRMSPNDEDKQKLLLRPNEDVERTRNAHRNDLENVVPFVVLGLFYVSTNPNPVTALWHFRLFLAFRTMHSFAYIGQKQPCRGLSYLGGFVVFASMACRTIYSTWRFL